MKTLDKYLDIANKITDLVGEYALKNFGGRKVTFHKAGLEYSVDEDKKANDLYEKFLKKETPEVALYTEEGEKNLDQDLVWTIDPIDGTSNYSLGIPFFNTQICLLKNKEPVVVVIFVPVLGQKFWAVKGQGAFFNGQKIKVTDKKDLEKSIFGISGGNTREDREWMGKNLKELLHYFRSPRVLSSTGVEMSYTASGIIDLFLSKGGATWDYAPGALLIREAGGVVLNLEGRQWKIEDRGLIASNEALIKQILELL